MKGFICMDTCKYFRRLTKKKGIRKDEHIMTETEYKEIRNGIRMAFSTRNEYDKWVNNFDKNYKENKMVVGHYTPIPDGSLPFIFNDIFNYGEDGV